MFEDKQTKDKVEKIGEATANLIKDVQRIESKVDQIKETIDKWENMRPKGRPKKTPEDVDREIAEEANVGMSKVEATIEGFQTQEAYDKLKKICEDITIKDETFRFEADDDNLEITIKSENKDDLHRRCMWLVKKTDIQNLKYNVEE
jgi:uncharacterized protein YoxC